MIKRLISKKVQSLSLSLSLSLPPSPNISYNNVVCFFVFVFFVRICYLGKGLYKLLLAFVPIHLYVYTYNKIFLNAD